MAVVGETVPITSTSMHVLRRAVHSASVFRPPRPGWNEAFVTPESVELFAPMVERSWQLHPTVAGVFRENRAPPSTDFLRLAQALTQPPDTSTDPSTWAPHPTAADFGFDDHAAVRAVTVAYLQTVRNLTPHAVKGGNIVLRGMLESEGLKGAADGRGIQGRLARVFNLDTAAYILLRRAVSCTTEMAKYPTELHAVWRLFASPGISSDFHFTADHTEALMAVDFDDESRTYAKHEATLAAQQGVHARRVASDITGRLRKTFESFALPTKQRSGPFVPLPPPGGDAATADAATAAAAPAAPANAPPSQPPSKLTMAEKRAIMRRKLSRMQTSSSATRHPAHPPPGSGSRGCCVRRTWGAVARLFWHYRRSPHHGPFRRCSAGGAHDRPGGKPDGAQRDSPPQRSRPVRRSAQRRHSAPSRHGGICSDVGRRSGPRATTP